MQHSHLIDLFIIMAALLYVFISYLLCIGLRLGKKLKHYETSIINYVDALLLSFGANQPFISSLNISTPFMHFGFN